MAAAFLASVVLMGACGSSSSGSSADASVSDVDAAPLADGGGDVDATQSGGDVPINSLVTLLAQVDCNQFFACCNAQQLTGVFGDTVPANAAACATQYATMLDIDREKAAVLAGTMVYSGAAARTCLDAIAASSCNAFSVDTPPAVCRDALIFIGQVAIDGDCQQDDECVATAACSPGGKCVARSAATESCAGGGSCLAGLYCDNDNICRPAQANGAACQGSDWCTSNECSSEGGGALSCTDVVADCPQ